MSVEFTVTELMDILVDCAGAADGLTDFDDISDVAFEDLGYDSIAVLEASSRVEQRFGVQINEDAIAELRTPADFVAHVVKAIEARGELVQSS